MSYEVEYQWADWYHQVVKASYHSSNENLLTGDELHKVRVSDEMLEGKSNAYEKEAD